MLLEMFVLYVQYSMFLKIVDFVDSKLDSK